MIKIENLTDNLLKEILDLLYKDEMYNTILIEVIEKRPRKIGNLYINRVKGKITEILHIKFDGNSNLTLFAYESKDGLKRIGDQINKIDYNKILLAGKYRDVACILQELGHDKSISPFTFFKLDLDNYRHLGLNYDCKIRLAEPSDKDLDIVKQFIIDFFEAETDEEISKLTGNDKILSKIKKGVYLLECEGQPVGMARFLAKTNNYAEITGVYIDKDYRKRGLGKKLINHVIKVALDMAKTPVLVASSSNFAAIRTYQAMGFKEEEDYAFEFLSLKI